VRRVYLGLALAALSAGCVSTLPASRLPEDDPRPAALLGTWRAYSAERSALQALARLAVDAPGAGADGGDLAFRTKQRLWLSRPAQLRVEVLGFLDTTVAVLTTDGERYALFRTEDHHHEEGPVYPGLLWDVARLDLTPDEAVEAILGALAADAEITPGPAYLVGERVRIEFSDRDSGAREVEFGAGGELRRLAQLDAEGELIWEALYYDFTSLEGRPLAHKVILRSAAGRARAELVLRNVELNPDIPPDIFRLRPPETPGGDAAEGG
jgi:hypothetical protein